MKKHVPSLTAAVLITLSTSGRSQLIVEDVAGIAQDAVQYATELAKWGQSISNQATQITHQVEQITNQVQQIEQMYSYLQAFGNPEELIGKFNIEGLLQTGNLWEVGQAYTEVMAAVDGAHAFTDNAGNLYTAFEQAPGTLKRNFEAYKKFDFLGRLRSNYQSYSKDYVRTGKVIKEEIAATLKELDGATDASQIAKLQGKLQGLVAEQQALQGELQRTAYDSIA
ncbi:MAG: hypothetical protein V4710_14370, partial [Verrucomicrobiota bacterium]